MSIDGYMYLNYWTKSLGLRLRSSRVERRLLTLSPVVLEPQYGNPWDWGITGGTFAFTLLVLTHRIS